MVQKFREIPVCFREGCRSRHAKIFEQAKAVQDYVQLWRKSHIHTEIMQLKIPGIVHSTLVRSVANYAISVHLERLCTQ